MFELDQVIIIKFDLMSFISVLSPALVATKF